jgi:hypothetical protein
MLTIGLRGAAGPADGPIQTAELGSGAGIEVTEAGNQDMGLIVEIEAIGDQLVVFDLDGAIGAPHVRAAVVGTAVIRTIRRAVTAGPAAAARIVAAAFIGCT